MSKAFWRDLKISLLGGKILFCRELLAIDVRGADEKVKVSPSTKKWEEEVAVWTLHAVVKDHRCMQVLLHQPIERQTPCGCKGCP